MVFNGLVGEICKKTVLCPTIPDPSYRQICEECRQMDGNKLKLLKTKNMPKRYKEEVQGQQIEEIKAKTRQNRPCSWLMAACEAIGIA